MPEPTNSPTTGVQPATQPATGVQPVSGVQPGVPFQDLTKWATKAPEGETLISTAYRDKVTDDLKFVENKPGVHKPDPILVADNVTRKFGGMTAVDVSHFEIERHGITALIGPNGAGKTTFFNLMTGFDTPNTGTWQFDGKDMAHVQPEKVARMGMVRTFQLTKVMSRLTVLDNMLLGAPVQPGEGMFRALFPGMWRKQEQANIEKAEALLERFLLIKKKDDYAGALSGGQRKLLEMARALMSDPKLVMLDEPMAGVNPRAETVAARPHHGVARGRHHSAVHRTRHQHGETHRRLGHRDGGRQDRGRRPTEERDERSGRDRRIPGRPRERGPGRRFRAGRPEGGLK